ncbi:MAG: hypothetical protein HY744_17820 [Deltaproteobacteria bacterium]|nr:hypothetical protein [Deltaproteobacteria bacterium]
MTNPTPLFVALGASLVMGTLVACGGVAVLDPVRKGGGEAGGGGQTTTTTTTTTTTSTTSSGTGAAGAGGYGGYGGGGEGAQGATGGAPPIPPLVYYDLGEMQVGVTATFEAPAGILGMTAMVEVLDGNKYEMIGFPTVAAPSGSPVIENYGIPGTAAHFSFPGAEVVAVPLSDHPEAMPIAPGVWQFEVGSEEDAKKAHLGIWVRQTLDGQFHGGVVDVNLFRTPGAPDEGYMKKVVKLAIGGMAGLKLGKLKVLPLDEQYAVLDENNFFEVFEPTKGAPGKPALNIMVVEMLTGELEGAAGFTLGAPGNPIEHGTLKSGVVVTTGYGEEWDTLIMRHETGHLAGLFHTSEFEDDLGDALDDTPWCDDPMGKMDSCPDYPNLMFPIAASGALLLSPKQNRVVQASALYRGIVEEGGGPADPLPDDEPGAGDEPEAGPAPGGGAKAAGAATPLAIPLAEQSWAARVPPGLAHYLAGLWCVRSGVDFFTVVRLLGGDDAAELLAMGTDRSAPLHVRMRALMAAGRASPSAGQIAQLVALAQSSSLPPVVRVGALGGLSAAAPGRARALAALLAAGADARVARVARRLRGAGAR